MKIPKYLSNTSVQLFYSDRMEFYLKYLADNRPPRMPQTQPMSVGSAFDAYVKSYIVERLVGVGGRPEFEREKIFETQVEPHLRDWARIAGQHAFDAYKLSGALADLMLELEQAEAEPRFEFTVQRTISGIPLLGKPDIWFVTREGMHVLIDWKVNGYCSRSAVSPKAGYIMCMDGWKDNHSRTHRRPHKNAQVMKVGGLMINAAIFLETVDKTWADQTSLYGWLMGEEIGGRFITGIDQLVAGVGDPPPIRVARHRCRVSAQYQQELWEKIKHVWETIHSGHIFDDLPLGESLTRQETLDNYHKAFEGGSPNEEWYQSIMRQHRF